MKRLLCVTSITLLIALSAAICCSCQNKLNAGGKDTVTDEYRETAILHNKGIEFVFDALKSQKQQGKNDLSIDNLNSLATQFLVDNDYNVQLSNEIYYKTHIQLNKTTRSISTTNTSVLSDAEIAYLNVLYNILYDNAKNDNYDDIESIIDALKATILLDDIITNKDPLLYACDVSYYSLLYWKDNLEKWLIEFGNYDNNTKGFWRQLLNDFIDTAIIDGTGAAVGVLLGGVGALPSALSTSIVYCATELVNRTNI